MKELLLEKELKELYQLRGEQYTSKEELVDDIISNDDGSVAELLQLKGGFLGILTIGCREPLPIDGTPPLWKCGLYI